MLYEIHLCSCLGSYSTGFMIDGRALLCGHEEKPTPNVLKYLLFAAIHPMLCICRIYSSFEGNLLNSNGEGNLLTWAQLDFLLATDQNATALKRIFVYFIYS